MAAVPGKVSGEVGNVSAFLVTTFGQLANPSAVILLSPGSSGPFVYSLSLIWPESLPLSQVEWRLTLQQLLHKQATGQKRLPPGRYPQLPARKVVAANPAQPQQFGTSLASPRLPKGCTNQPAAGKMT